MIVTSPDPSDVLRDCVASLAAQEDASEIVVAASSDADPHDWLQREFPSVRVLVFPEPRTSPQLRWAALAHTSGRLVAATESRCVPSRDWCATLVRAHERWRDAPAIGGPVTLTPSASALDWGLYLSEYARFAPPLADGPADEISGANLSYKRQALDEARDQLDAGAWEVFVHARWIAQGRRLAQSQATVTFRNGMSASAALGLRFRYGRSYAAGRSTTIPAARRLVLIAGSPLLPAVLTWRLFQTARRKRLVGPFARSFAWSLAFNIAWSAGELVGYVSGR